MGGAVRLAVTAAAVAAVAAGLFVAIGPDRVWRVFGDPDLGPVDFAQVQRRPTGNDALACPPGLCSAPADITTGLYPVTAADLRRVFAHAMSAQPRVTRVAADDAALTDRYIARSRLLGFPDTIVVQFFARGAGQSTLAVSSRSQLGRSDMGVNRARVTLWLDLLSRLVPPVP